MRSFKPKSSKNKGELRKMASISPVKDVPKKDKTKPYTRNTVLTDAGGRILTILLREKPKHDTHVVRASLKKDKTSKPDYTPAVFHAKREAADAAFDVEVKKAEAKGWAKRTKGARSSNATLDEIPDATAKK
jgi:hypothetical protein